MWQKRRRAEQEHNRVDKDNLPSSAAGFVRHRYAQRLKSMRWQCSLQVAQ